MLGRYENFPENVHGITLFEYHGSAKDLQKAILYTLHHLNQETFDLGAVTPCLKQNCEVSFEFGVADGIAFNFFDQKELEHCLKSVDETEVEILDFFFAVCYHSVRDGGKRVPLRFDYYVLRFSFQEGGLELRIRHERGIQRVPVDDSTDFLVKQINVELSRRQLAPLFFGVFKKASIH